MKKNKTLRFAACLLLLCLITTCVIGTTLAKYTTAGSASDEAHVAKWGVQITMEADPLFKNEYAKTDSTNTQTLTVKSKDDAKVVAPGTSSTEAYGSAVFAISGTPEVAVRVKIELTGVQNVFLKAGTYQDPTTAADATFTLDNDYYPVVFTLTQTKDENGVSNKNIITGTLATIQAALNDYNGGENGNGKDYAPNTNLTSEYTLSWAWNFEGGNDQADTYLGNLMAGINPDNLQESAYCLNVAYTLSVTVTQIN